MNRCQNGWKLKQNMDEARMGRHESVFRSIMIRILQMERIHDFARILLKEICQIRHYWKIL